MALLRIKGLEPKDIPGMGEFVPGKAKYVPDNIARTMVRSNHSLWAIEVPAAEKAARQKQFANDRKMDSKRA